MKLEMRMELSVVPIAEKSLNQTILFNRVVLSEMLWLGSAPCITYFVIFCIALLYSTTVTVVYFFIFVIYVKTIQDDGSIKEFGACRNLTNYGDFAKFCPKSTISDFYGIVDYENEKFLCVVFQKIDF